MPKLPTTPIRAAAGGLLAILISACGGEPPVLQITGTDPEASATLPFNQGVLVRVAYQAKDPVRFHAVGYRGGVEFKGTTNVGVTYAAGTGVAAAFLAYPQEQEIDEVRVIASDQRWRRLSEVSAPLALRWTPGAPAHTRSEWARVLEADLSARARQMMTK